MRVLSVLFLVSVSFSFSSVQKSEYDIPVYKKYAAFEHLLHQDNDSIYVINFWATYCKPCIEEMPYFEQINADYADKKVKVILVSLDFESHLSSRVIPLLEAKNIQSKVVILDDPKAHKWVPQVDKKWSGALPATVIYRGNKRAFYEKSFDLESLEKALKPFLK